MNSHEFPPPKTQQWQWWRFYNLWQLLGLQSGDMTHTLTPVLVIRIDFHCHIQQRRQAFTSDPSSQSQSICGSLKWMWMITSFKVSLPKKCSLWLHAIVVKKKKITQKCCYMINYTLVFLDILENKILWKAYFGFRLVWMKSKFFFCCSPMTCCFFQEVL